MPSSGNDGAAPRTRAASEPRERSEPTKRLARERVGAFEGRSPSIEAGRDAASEPGTGDFERTMTPVVDLENLKVKLGRREILHGITCRLGVSGTGKAVGLLGPNGAGKSTLILTLLGFLRPSAGRASILGMDCRRNMGEARSRIGYMPENDSFVGEMTAVTFVRQMAELSGLPPKAALEKAHEVLFHVGLGE
jgi:ABC-type multidrug transport system fused ATPase/permease subunit